MTPVLAVDNVSKSFGPNQVLRGVSFQVERGEIYALMGATGAGKSTLIKVLCGAHQSDAGTISINGERVDLNSPLLAQRHGIGTVHQNPNDGVVLDMTVAENLALDTLTDTRSRPGFSRRRTETNAREVAATLGMKLTRDMLRSPVRDLGVSERQLLVLARTISHRPEILILDEPTSALSAEEITRLFDIVRSLAADGMTVLFVTHKLSEIDEISGHVGVLRDGAMQGEYEKTANGSYDWPVVLKALFDRTPSEMKREEITGDETVLAVRGAQIFAESPPFDMEVRSGEVTALLGLLGSGKTELLEWVFGAGTVVAGTRELDRRPFTPAHPQDAIDKGVYLVPESRHEQAIIPGWSISSLMTLPFTKKFSSSLLMRRRLERDATRSMMSTIGVIAQGPSSEIETLSGGNQQKTVIGRWLLGQPRVLLLDEPFRGVDINARHDIGETVRGLVDRAAVLVATSDIDEAFEVADRIIVFSQGHITADYRLGKANRDDIIEAMSHRPSDMLAADESISIPPADQPGETTP